MRWQFREDGTDLEEEGRAGLLLDGGGDALGVGHEEIVADNLRTDSESEHAHAPHNNNTCKKPSIKHSCSLSVRKHGKSRIPPGYWP